MKFDEQEEQFIRFIESFGEFYKPAYIIASNNSGKSILSKKRGKNRFSLYSLDEICRSADIFREDHLEFYPKTTDAIWFKKSENGLFNIFLIEFKGDKLYNKSTKCLLFDYLNRLKKRVENPINDLEKSSLYDDIMILEKVCRKYSDKMLNSLAFKPLETVVVALPLIYEEYYNRHKNENGIKHIDIRSFLKQSNVIFRVVAFIDSNNPSKNRANNYRMSNIVLDDCRNEFLKESDKEITLTYEDNLQSFYRRFQKAGIIDDYDFLETNGFNNFIDNALK